MRIGNKRAAIEMSISTIVIIVIAITMLVFGIVFVRNIMCSAINLTSDTGNYAQSEITKLFGSSGSEVQCIGAETVSLVPGQVNAISCGIKAKSTGQYEIDITNITTGKSITNDMIQSWIVANKEGWSGPVAPGDETPKKIIRLAIPDNAPEDSIILSIEAKKDGQVISSQDLDFQIQREGLIKSTMC